MNLKTLAIAALLGVSVPSLAFAQASTTPAPNDASSTVGADQPDALGAPKFSDFDAFLQGFGAADFTSTTSVMDSAKSYNIVKLSTLANADAAKLQGPMDERSEELASLRANIGANAAAKAALEAEGLSSDNVVWIETGVDGAVTIYVTDL